MNPFSIQSNNGEVLEFYNQAEGNVSVECKTNNYSSLLCTLIVAGTALFVVTSVLTDGSPVQISMSPPALIRQSESPVINLGRSIIRKDFGNSGIILTTREYRTALSMINGASDIYFNHTVSDYTYDDILRREVEFKEREVVVVNGKLVSQESGFKSFFAGFPLITFGDIKNEWSNFTDVSLLKAIVLFCGTAITSVFGAFTILNQVLFCMTVFHFITRLIANKYKDKDIDKYASTSRAIQLFFWSYILLAVGNQLSNVLVLNGIPEGTFFAFLKMAIIYMDFRGALEQAEIAKLPVPGFLKVLANIKTTDLKPPL